MTSHKIAIIPVIIGMLAYIYSCGNSTISYFPKPRGYHRIELPPHKYELLNDEYPYNFEMSAYSTIIPDTSRNAGDYWINIYYPSFDAFINITYKSVNNNIDSLIGYSSTSHTLTNKHQVRAKFYPRI